MKSYTIDSGHAQFSSKIDIIDPTDTNHADYLNVGIKQTFQNTVYNHAMLEQLKEITGAPDEYSTGTAYQIGEYCLHEGVVYKCIADISAAGAWDASNWEKVTLLGDLEKAASGESAPIKFEEPQEREKLVSGDGIKVLFGKIAKWLNDLKPVAFSEPVANLLATEKGKALDATQGKVLNDRINKLTASGAITDVQIVDALPADAADHPTTFYWVKG